MADNGTDDQQRSSEGVQSKTRAAQHRLARAQKACVFCRGRKIRCTGERPQCKNCDVYGQDCIYSEQPRKQRPTYAALKQLQEENEKLRERASLGQVSTSPSGAEEPVAGSVDDVQPTPAPAPLRVPAESESRPKSPIVRRVLGSVGGASTYHGPTSTLFDDAVVNQQLRPRLSSEREAWMPRLLLAAAAEQRQLETINARSGSLDFDGVDAELGLHLLNLHWNRQHHSFLVTYRPAFMRDMACGGPYFSRILLNAIYYGASKFSPRLELRKYPADVRTAGWRFRSRVRDLLGQALDHSAITTIQALLQMSSSLFALGDEQSAAWVYAGTAFRMLFDLGLHVDPTMLSNVTRLSDEDIEIRRRVYWSAFVVDKMQSLYQGRPASLRAAECQVSLKFLDTYEEMEHWQPFAYTSDSDYPGSAGYSISTFTELCRLCIVLNEILDKMYSDGRSNKPVESLIDDLKSVETRLQEWSSALPTHLSLDLQQDATKFQIPPPHVLSLLAMWNVLRVLLHRPFVSEGHLHPASPSVAVSSFVACSEAASNIVRLVRLYDRAFSVRRAPYLISYATYVAATVHVRIAAVRNQASEVQDSLRTCLSVFDQNSETNYAVRKASLVIKNLMKKMGVSLPDAGISRSGDKRANATESIDATGREYLPNQPPSGLISETNEVHGSTSNLPFAPMSEGLSSDMDLEAIIQNFMNEPQAAGAQPSTLYSGTSTQGLTSFYGPGMQNAAPVSHSGNLSYQDDSIGAFDNIFGFNTMDLGWYSS